MIEKIESPFKKRSKITLVLSLFFYPITLGGALFFAGFMVLGFNGVTSTAGVDMIPWKLTMLLLIIYPVLILIALLVAWHRYSQGRYRSAFIITLLPLLDIPITFIMAIIAFITISISYS